MLQNSQQNTCARVPLLLKLLLQSTSGRMLLHLETCQMFMFFCFLKIVNLFFHTKKLRYRCFDKVLKHLWNLSTNTMTGFYQ